MFFTITGHLHVAEREERNRFIITGSAVFGGVGNLAEKLGTSTDFFDLISKLSEIGSGFSTSAFPAFQRGRETSAPRAGSNRKVQFLGFKLGLGGFEEDLGSYKVVELQLSDRRRTATPADSPK